MILRVLGFIYAIAFMVAINQILPLIGSNGLLPVGEYLERVTDAVGSKANGFIRAPSLFWFDHSDTSLLIGAWIGFLLACLVAAGFANAIILAVLWFLYLSFVHVGQEWYGFGWEIQLTETGFLAIFLCPLLDMRPFPRAAPPMPVIVLFRWLTFRIMLGAGLIKIRGNTIWHDGTALFYHFETQPLPGPLSRWFHFLPRLLLKTGVWMNHLAELIAPWFVFWPRLARQIAGSVIILFQATLILSGNLSFLNWLTIVPALACFDDGFWARLLPRLLVRKAETAAAAADISKPMIISSRALAVLIGVLSIQPVSNMLSSKQIMNTSYDPLDLVNTYGAFGTVEKDRMNLIFEGTMDDEPNEQADWKPYIYKGLPVLTDRRPPQVSPYQLRLDWQLWFAAMSNSDEYPWTLNLVSKLLHNDPGALSLLAQNPFQDQPPKFIRVVRYHYSFAKPGNSKGLWWNRKRVDIWLEPLSIRDASIRTYNKHL